MPLVLYWPGAAQAEVSLEITMFTSWKIVENSFVVHKPREYCDYDQIVNVNQILILSVL